MPRFQILEIVRISDHRHLAGQGPTRRPGCVTEIREYSGSTFRYRVRGLDRADDDEAYSLNDEQDLEPTDEQAPAELFALPGGFRRGEVIRVAARCDVREAAGQTGMVDGTYTPEAGSASGSTTSATASSSHRGSSRPSAGGCRPSRCQRPGTPPVSAPVARSPGIRRT